LAAFDCLLLALPRSALPDCHLCLLADLSSSLQMDLAAWLFSCAPEEKFPLAKFYRADGVLGLFGKFP